MPEHCQYGMLHAEEPCVYCERDAARKRVEELEARVRSLEAEGDYLRKQKDAVTTEMDKARQRVAVIETMVKNRERDNLTLAGDCDAFQKRAEALETNVQELEKELSEERIAESNMEIKYEDAKRERDELREQLELAVRERAQEREDHLHDHNRSACLERENAELRAEVATLRGRLGCDDCECISEEQCQVCGPARRSRG